MVVSFELEQYMNNNHYTLDECARQIDVSVSTIKKWTLLCTAAFETYVKEIMFHCGIFYFAGTNKE